MIKFAKKKPVLKYKSILDYILGTQGRNPKIIEWFAQNLGPCQKCGGRGSHTHPDWRPCPVEGNRHADYVTCERCNGTGQVPVKCYREMYKAYMAEHRKDLAKWKAKKAIYDRIRINIDQNEIRDILELCVHEE